MSENLDLFRFWIEQGWKYRLPHNEHMQANKRVYKERMHHEYETICAREGFVDYFLIVSDLIRWAKAQGIAVGPGRGSSAGSLICYLLRITEIDSLQFPMLFERFLDPTRTDPPDIDIDFESDRRDEVFGYAASKYGKERVANIGTFTRYLGRNSLDDIARVYHVAGWKIDAIKGKLIDRAEGHPRFSKTLEDTYNSFADVREIVQEQPELHYAPKLEGNIRNFSVHAAGMVISSQALDNICATYQREMNNRVAQCVPFNKYDASYVGLLKVDLLSLITMSEIANICKLAGMTLEELYRIPLDDNATLEAFRSGDVMGVFQFEGPTTRRILKKVAPTKFMHLSDVNALSRPGADDKEYIRNKNSGQVIDYVHSVMREHLSWTYGVVVYEEQILMILRDLGGFEPTELNTMRKIIHDKLGSTAFNEYYQRFIKGADLPEATAKQIWDGMVSASGYAFNIAHSVSYAHIGYWSQWLKIHYPAPFFTAKLNKCTDDIRRGKLIQEAERHGIDVVPPRLLESGHNWTLSYEYNKPMILAGLDAVPGIGPKKVDAIVDWRLEQQAAVGVDDFFPEWEDLTEISGFGPKTIANIRLFCDSPDPFGVHKMARTLEQFRKRFIAGEFAGIPTPTHISIDIPPEPEVVCYMGIARARKYYDAVEQLQKRTAGELSYEDALEQLDDPHLLKYVALDVEDEYGETVRVRISRWRYPTFVKEIQNIKLNRDVVVVQGKSSDFGGISIQTKQLTVLNGDYNG
jgi:DNA polymerase III subunit alpha